VSRLLLSALLLVALLTAQTTEGLISGAVSDLVTGQPLAGATIEYATSQTHGSVSARNDGSYDLPLLAPGIYSLRASKPGYQPRLIYELQLTVGGYLSLRFQLRPLADVWERNVPQSIILGNQSVLSYLGPDVDPSFSGAFDPEPNQRGQLEPSISEVIDPVMIATLPLTGRDAYTALVWMPGVATDAATARSLGLSANGQRPTSSNFLLDGVEFNNHLISGPAISVPPEGISEYRVSTNNFSAEYGGTSGYIANAVTKTGGSAWHGLLYSYSPQRDPIRIYRWWFPAWRAQHLFIYIFRVFSQSKLWRAARLRTTYAIVRRISGRIVGGPSIAGTPTHRVGPRERRCRPSFARHIEPYRLAGSNHRYRTCRLSAFG
jgi:Carboxypeptidase regulatory-like domain